MLRKACLISIMFLSFLVINGCTPGLVSVDHQGKKSNLTPLSQSSDSSTCQVVELQGSAKDTALQQALADSQVQWLIDQMQRRGHRLNLEAAQAFQIGEASLQVLIFFKPDGRLSWWRKESGETLARAIISRKHKLEILEPYSDWQRFRLTTTTELKEVLKDLHKNKEFQKVKKDLEDNGYKLAEEKTRGVLNETKGEYFLWLRWQRQESRSSTSRVVPLLIDDGYSTGGGGGTDIAVIYDPNTGRLFLFIVPPDLVRFMECMGECLLETLGPEGIIALIIAFEFCKETCSLCRPITIYNPACWGCGLCIVGGVAGAAALGTYCASKCIKGGQ